MFVADLLPSLLARRRGGALAALVALSCSSPELDTLTGISIAPRPFSAEQIRAENPPGTVLLFRIERDGRVPILQETRFVSADEKGAVIQVSFTDENGEALGERSTSEATWRELRDHATFPALHTGRLADWIEVPAGTFECWLYTVSAASEGEPILTRYWFAKSRPGPPIQVEVQRAGQTVMRTVLLQASHS